MARFPLSGKIVSLKETYVLGKATERTTSLDPPAERRVTSLESLQCQWRASLMIDVA